MTTPTLFFEGDLPSLSRFDTYVALNLVRVMEPETEFLMEERALRTLQEDEYDSPHGRAWHVSFHASEFPGSETEACPRYLTYRMMNFVADKPMPPWVTTTGDVGKAGELTIASSWFDGGRMLAPPEDDAQENADLKKALDAYMHGDHELGARLAAMAERHQLGFVDEVRWMTASTDLPVLPPGWRKPYIVEVKCKADDVVDQMLDGEVLPAHGDQPEKRAFRGPDPKHVIQLGATIGKAHDYDWGEVTVCSECWFILRADVYERMGLPGGIHPRSDVFHRCPRCKDYGEQETFKLEQPDSGEIYYWSRSWPRKTKSFFQVYDPEFMRRGLEVVAEAQQHFINDTLPEIPRHFKWSLGACKFCQFKPKCRMDQGIMKPRDRKPKAPPIERLHESNQLVQTMGHRPTYQVGRTRAAVFAEWGMKDPIDPEFFTLEHQRDDIIDKWHQKLSPYPEGMKLHEALGMTWDQYQVWSKGKS